MTTDNLTDGFSSYHVCTCVDLGDSILVCRHCMGRYYRSKPDENIADKAHKALQDDEEWKESNMGPAASLAHKYYVRGFIAGYNERIKDEGSQDT